MTERSMLQIVSIMATVVVFVVVTGCPPQEKEIQDTIIKSLFNMNCQGCNPQEGEGELEGEPVEGELAEGEPGEGEVVIEGEQVEGETIEGESVEGEPDEGEVIEGEAGEGEFEGEPAEGEGGTREIMLPGDVSLELVWVPSGTFQMGRYSGEAESYAEEDPQHGVTLSGGFWMGKYEITQQQWLAVMDTWPGDEPTVNNGLGDTYPAYNISWDDVKSYMTSLNAHIISTGQGPMTVRLPSEAEWEYACRAGTNTRFYFGDSLGCAADCSDCAAGVMPGNRSDYMWYCGNYITSGSYARGGKTSNAFGLHDMSGNVVEWCEDDYHDGYTGAPTNGSAWVDSPRATYRIMRGGRYADGAENCRSASRRNSKPDFRYAFVGFRVAAD
jgi:formylglycine-generating enzyme required for sulfatase activity